MIRRLRLSDRDELVRMRQALWRDSTEAEVDTLLAAPPPDAEILVAERSAAERSAAERSAAERPGAEGREGRLCGFAELGTRRFAEGCDSSPVAYLEGIWVDPDVRRTGVALALVREAEAWARSSGFTEFGSDCAIENEASQAFHTAAGFSEAGRIVCFKKPLGQ